MSQAGSLGVKLVVFLTRGMSLEKWAQGGVLERELAIYDRLADRGVITTFVSWGGREEGRYTAERPHVHVRGNIFGLGTASYERLLPVLHAPIFWKADIIKTNQMNGADLALRCSRMWRVPLLARCGFMWSDFRRMQGKVAGLARIRDIERSAYTQTACGIVTTDAMRDYLVREYGCIPERIKVVPNYVPESFFNVPSAVRTTQPVVLAVGRLEEQKNFAALIKACAGFEVTLRIIGEGILRDGLIELALRHGVTLQMPGKIAHEQLPGEIASATIFAQLSLYEGHPKTLLEAMACGAPILASNSPGIANVVEHDGTALVCDTDVASIRSGLLRLLNNSEQRNRLGSAARDKALALYSLGVVSEQEWRIYREITRG
jgi:glycosyltransferase involved in cell wall biosynthesis